MDRRRNFDRFTRQLEATGEDAGPQIESLLDVGNIADLGFATIGEQQSQANAAEVQAMWILTQPVVKFGLVFAAGLIADLAPVRVVLRQQKWFRLEPGRHRCGMPAPL